MRAYGESMFQAYKNNGYREIVTETVNANTSASFVKEQMAENNGEVLGARVVKTFEKVVLVFARDKSRGCKISIVVEGTKKIM